MELQNFEKKDLIIRKKFKNYISNKKDIKDKIKFSWSSISFGFEPIEDSLKRLEKNKVKYIELPGNLYGKDTGFKSRNLKKILSYYGIEVSGVVGISSRDIDLASSSPITRQRSIDYIKMNAEFCAELKGEYLLVVPGAVGRPNKYDNFESERVVETLRIVGDILINYNIKGAIEPISAYKVSICHSFDDAVKMINAIKNKGIKHINGDVFHMFYNEEHIGETIMKYGDYLINLHMADTNRKALGNGMLDLDVIIMALYLIGYNGRKAFCTPELLGPVPDLYTQMSLIYNPEVLDILVHGTVSYFREREKLVLNIDN